MANRNIPAVLSPVGFQTLSLANSTALPLNTTCRAGSVFCFSVETNSARYRSDAVVPALTTGVLLAIGLTWLFNVPGTGLRFQRSTGTSKVSVMAYKYGD